MLRGVYRRIVLLAKRVTNVCDQASTCPQARWQLEHTRKHKIPACVRDSDQRPWPLQGRHAASPDSFATLVESWEVSVLC